MEVRKFKDETGEEWIVRLDVAINREVRKQLGVDLLSFSDEGLYARLIVEPELLVDVLFVVLTEQIERLELDERGFARRLAGDAIETAAEALLEAIADFFPPRRRKLIQRALTKSAELMERQTTHAEETLESPQLKAAIEAEMQRNATKIDEQIEQLRLGTSSTTGAGCLESTPAPSASEN